MIVCGNCYRAYQRMPSVCTCGKTINKVGLFSKDSPIAVGDVVRFGTYLQEELTWRVLDTKDDKILIITEAIIDTIENKEQAHSFLNDTVLNQFTTQEKNDIEIVSRSHREWTLFLLNPFEVKKYMPNHLDSICSATQRARLKQSCGKDGYYNWLLESTDLWVSEVGNKGYMRHIIGRGIRPAAWVYKDGVTLIEKGKYHYRYDTYDTGYEVGKKITLGTYKNTPIKWTIYEIKDGVATIVADEVIEVMKFGTPSDKLSTDGYYHDSDVRKWLNTVLYNGFSQADRERICLNYEFDEGTISKEYIYIPPYENSPNGGYLSKRLQATLPNANKFVYYPYFSRTISSEGKVWLFYKDSCSCDEMWGVRPACKIKINGKANNNIRRKIRGSVGNYVDFISGDQHLRFRIEKIVQNKALLISEKPFTDFGDYNHDMYDYRFDIQRFFYWFSLDIQNCVCEVKNNFTEDEDTWDYFFFPSHSDLEGTLIKKEDDDGTLKKRLNENYWGHYFNENENRRIYSRRHVACWVYYDGLVEQEKPTGSQAFTDSKSTTTSNANTTSTNTQQKTSDDRYKELNKILEKLASRDVELNKCIYDETTNAALLKLKNTIFNSNSTSDDLRADFDSFALAYEKYKEKKATNSNINQQASQTAKTTQSSTTTKATQSSSNTKTTQASTATKQSTQSTSNTQQKSSGVMDKERAIIIDKLASLGVGRNDYIYDALTNAALLLLNYDLDRKDCTKEKLEADFEQFSKAYKLYQLEHGNKSTKAKETGKETPKSSNEKKDSKKAEPKTDLGLSVGMQIPFGRYDNRNIYWTILNIKDNNIFIQASSFIDLVAFGGNGKYIPSDIRKWLNTYFFSLFSDVERNMISTVTIDGNKDYFFLLGSKELEQYYQAKSSRVLSDAGVSYCWWLRNSGNVDGTASFVFTNGDVYEMDSNTTSIAVRPCCWIKMK